MYTKIQENKNRFLLTLVFLTSHVFLIASYSVIDYVIGTLFGFLFLDYLKKGKFKAATILIIISCAIRLSNIIFLAAGILFLLLKKIEYKTFYTLYQVLCLLVYFITRPFLLADGFCFLNLTNINHELVPRLGFFYKQAQFLEFNRNTNLFNLYY